MPYGQESFSNNATSTLGAAITTTGQTAITLAAGADAAPWPTSGRTRVLIDSEILLVTAGLGTTSWTVTRGAEGTTAATHANGATVTQIVTRDALVSLRGGGSKLLVASSTASQAIKDQAYSVCDGTADNVEIVAALAVLSAGGGGDVELSGGGFDIAALIELPHKCGIVGSGWKATELNRANALLGPLIYNHASTNGSTDANAKELRVCNLRINGNRANVTPPTTTTSGTNAQGGTTLTVTSTAGLPAAPNWMIIVPTDAAGNREVVRYTAKPSGTTLTLQDGMQFGHAAGQTVSQYWAEILFQPYPSWDPKPSADEYEGAGNIIRDVWIQNAKMDGIAVYGFSDTRIDQIETLYCDLRGIAVGADSWLTNVNVGHSGYEGISISNNVHAVNAVSYYSGDVAPTLGYGFRIEGQLGGKITGCYAQDNKADGYMLSWCKGFTLAGCNSDTNGAAWNGTGTSPYAGLAFSGQANYNTVTGMTCASRSNGFQSQTHAVSFRDTQPTGNQISLVHLNTGQTILGPINPTSGYGTGLNNNLTVNNQLGQQSVAYAASITPDPYAGGKITVAALTGGITIVNPTNRHPGVDLRLNFTQDATGGRQVTWGTDFDASGWQPSSVPSSKSSVSYQWDGTKWTLTGSDVDIYAAPILVMPVGLYGDALTTVTALTTNVSYFVYLGRVSRAITTVQVVANVTTLAATITWAEVGVFKGASNPNGTASLTRVGFTNVAATFNNTGRKVTSVTVSSVQPGDELWAAVGSQATTPYQLRGLLADDLQSGVFQTFAGRISTMATPSTTTLASATQVPPWLVARF